MQMTIQSLLQDALSMYINYQTCPTQPSAYPRCNMLWASIYIGMAILTLVFFMITLLEMLQNRKAWKNYLKKKAQREAIADSETMANHLWNAEF